MPGLDFHQALARPAAHRKSAPSIGQQMPDQNHLPTSPQLSGKKRKRKPRKSPEDRSDFSLGALRRGLEPPNDHVDLERKEVAFPSRGLVNGLVHPGNKSLPAKEKSKEEIRNEEMKKKRKKKKGKVLQSSQHANTCSDLSVDNVACIENEKKSLLEWVETGLQLESKEERTSGSEGLVNGHEGAKAAECCLQLEDGVIGRMMANGRGKTLHQKKRKENDRVLQYVLKRCVVVRPSPVSNSHFRGGKTTRTDVDVWGELIPVTLTNEASVVEEWVLRQNGGLFGLDIEWRPGRVKGVHNKVALLQLCGENECLIVQMLFLDRNPESLKELLFDPMKNLAGVGVHSDSKRLLQDHGLVCQGEIELTTLAVQRLKREELKHVGLKALVWEVLGLNMKKSKRVTLSNWAKRTLNRAQVEYACIDAWASFALSRKLTALC